MSKTVKVTRGAALGLDLTEDWTRDDYSADTARARRLEWRELDALLDARHATLATERAEAETAEAAREARRAAMKDAAATHDVSVSELREALDVERDALLVAKAERAEWEASRADDMQVFAWHAEDSTRNNQARAERDSARRHVPYVAASVMLSALPRRSNVMLSTRLGETAINVYTLDSAPAPSVVLPRLLTAEREESSRVSTYDSVSALAEAEARVSRWGTPSGITAKKLVTAERNATRATRHAHSARHEYGRAMQASQHGGIVQTKVTSLEIPAGISALELFAWMQLQATELANNVPARNDVHPFPTKLGRGKTTGTTQATKPGTRLILAERSSRVVDPYDAIAEAKRAARRERDARRTGQTVKNRATARVIALSDFHAGLELLETVRAHNDARQIAAERDAERRAEAARKRRANQSAEDKAARNMALRNKRRAAKVK